MRVRVRGSDVCTRFDSSTPCRGRVGSRAHPSCAYVLWIRFFLCAVMHPQRDGFEVYMHGLAKYFLARNATGESEPEVRVPLCFAVLSIGGSCMGK